MKTKITILFVMLLAALTTYAADKTTEVFTLDHQMSAHCEKKITENLRFEKGITDLKVSLKDNTITITYKPDKTNAKQIIEAFKKIGFNARLINDSDSTSKDASGSCCDNHKE